MTFYIRLVAKNFTFAKLFLIILTFFNFSFSARIKDIAIVQGVRENFIQGYGLVTGLSGTGDNLQKSTFTKKEFRNFLSKFNIEVELGSLNSKNVAAVIVTSTLPSFAKIGRRIDVKVSSIGDATSLSGGVLLPTQLVGSDGNTYAIAQGNVQVQKFSPFSRDVKSKADQILTNGLIDGGAIVEVDLGYQIDPSSGLKVVLNNPDFTTAVLITDSINDSIYGNIASAIDSGTVSIVVPNNRRKDFIKLISEIESIEVNTDGIAKVVINEVTGTIVIGNNVKINPVAVSHGNMSVDIFSSFVKDEKNITGNKYKKASRNLDQLRGTQLAELESVSLRELVDALNKFGVLPKDMIDILKTIKAAGAMNAVIEVR